MHLRSGRVSAQTASVPSSCCRPDSERSPRLAAVQTASVPPSCCRPDSERSHVLPLSRQRAFLRLAAVQTASVPPSCCRHHISETPIRSQRKGAASVKLSTPQSIADNKKPEKKRKRTRGWPDRGHDQLALSKDCQITHAT